MELPETISINDKVYTVSREHELDEGGNDTEFVQLDDGETKYRLSPNATVEDLQKFADPEQKGHVL